MDDLAATIGDTLRWNVQGITISSTIVGIREVSWDEPQPNFFVVFPDGVLNYAPQFFATTVRTSTRAEALVLQQQIVNRYPNISALDIGLLIESFRDFLNQITFVIQFIGLFSILTGLIVLAGAAASSRYQRQKKHNSCGYWVLKNKLLNEYYLSNFLQSGVCLPYLGRPFTWG